MTFNELKNKIVDKLKYACVEEVIDFNKATHEGELMKVILKPTNRKYSQKYGIYKIVEDYGIEIPDEYKTK